MLSDREQGQNDTNQHISSLAKWGARQTDFDRRFAAANAAITLRNMARGMPTTVDAARLAECAHLMQSGVQETLPAGPANSTARSLVNG